MSLVIALNYCAPTTQYGSYGLTSECGGTIKGHWDQCFNKALRQFEP